MDWSALATAGLAATAALVGVGITQRSQRLTAHDTRAWEKRAQIYVEVREWTTKVFRATGGTMRARLDPGEAIPMLTDKQQATFFTFAPFSIRQAYEEVLGALDNHYISEEGGAVAFGQDEAVKLMMALVGLEEVMIHDIGRGGQRMIETVRRRTWGALTSRRLLKQLRASVKEARKR